MQSPIITHEAYMLEAIQLARKAAAIEEVPIGAIVVHRGIIIGRGYNRREIDKNPLAHAELMAIEEAALSLGGWRLEQCQLYVTLEPCPMCAGAIVQSRLETLIFGTRDPKSGYSGSLHNTLQDERLNHQVKIVEGIYEQECKSLLQDFFRQLRKNKKASRPKE